MPNRQSVDWGWIDFQLLQSSHYLKVKVISQLFYYSKKGKGSKVFGREELHEITLNYVTIADGSVEECSISRRDYACRPSHRLGLIFSDL